MWRKPVDREPTWFDLLLCYLSETKTENMYWNALLTITHRSPRRCIYIEWDWTQNNICIVQINSRTDEHKHKHTRTHMHAHEKSQFAVVWQTGFVPRTEQVFGHTYRCMHTSLSCCCILHSFICLFFCLSVRVRCILCMQWSFYLRNWPLGTMAKKRSIQVELQMEIYSKNHKNTREYTVNLIDWIPDEFWCDKFSPRNSDNSIFHLCDFDGKFSHSTVFKPSIQNWIFNRLNWTVNLLKLGIQAISTLFSMLKLIRPENRSLNFELQWIVRMANENCWPRSFNHVENNHSNSKIRNNGNFSCCSISMC